MSTLTRRAALYGIASIPAMGAALAAQTVPAETSPIMTLFNQWFPIYERAYREPFDFDPAIDGSEDALARRLCGEMYALETGMAALPSTDLADLAAKVAAFTSLGEFGLGDGPFEQSVLDDVCSLLGISPATA